MNLRGERTTFPRHLGCIATKFGNRFQEQRADIFYATSKDLVIEDPPERRGNLVG